MNQFLQFNFQDKKFCVVKTEKAHSASAGQCFFYFFNTKQFTKNIGDTL